MSTPSLKSLLNHKQAIEQRIAQKQEQAKIKAIETIKDMILDHNLKFTDIFESKTKKPVVAKYKNPETGQTWTGRGKTPKWLFGKQLNDFKI